MDYNNGLKNADYEAVAETLRTIFKDVKKKETVISGPVIDGAATGQSVVDGAVIGQSRLQL
jgi:hypothetical protein